MNKPYFLLLILLWVGCKQVKVTSNNEPAPFLWENATVYFLLTDRFYNGDSSNDQSFNRTGATGKLRNFMGGDIAGVTKKINEGYFTELGVTAIWMTPVFEQIKESVDEGQGATYGYHGYWTRDWTALDPAFGTDKEYQAMVEAAHAKGIRIIMDVIANHTGPVTTTDTVWPTEWVRTEPQCSYSGYETTVNCTLVKNLPDIRTESNQEVELPEFLISKWSAEGRLEKEIASLNEFFTLTGYPRTPRYYIIKWLVDYIRKFGIDGFRVDTAKHTEESVWADLYKEAIREFENWKKNNPTKVIDSTTSFYMVGEVYGYGIDQGKNYSFGDSLVNYFDNGFSSLINFQFKYDGQKSYDQIFSAYSNILSSELKGKSVLNYLASHDDGSPFDKSRTKSMEAANKLLLAPGGAQIYYGDEINRPLSIPDVQGDANLRSFMNWEDLQKESDLHRHYQKLGKFRRNHPAIGAGIHKQINASPYVFSREYTDGDYKDVVVVGLDLISGKKEISIGNVFEKSSILLDEYSGKTCTVENGKIIIDTPYSYVLLSINK